VTLVTPPLATVHENSTIIASRRSGGVIRCIVGREPRVRAHIRTKQRCQALECGEAAHPAALDLLYLAASVLVSVGPDLAPEPHQKRAICR
jgi:hypothetical protein